MQWLYLFQKKKSDIINNEPSTYTYTQYKNYNIGIITSAIYTNSKWEFVSTKTNILSSYTPPSIYKCEFNIPYSYNYYDYSPYVGVRLEQGKDKISLEKFFTSKTVDFSSCLSLIDNEYFFNITPLFYLPCLTDTNVHNLEEIYAFEYEHIIFMTYLAANYTNICFFHCCAID